MKFKIFLINLFMSSLTLGFQPLEPISSSENPKELVWKLGKPYLTNIYEIQTSIPLEGSVQTDLWSGDYWPSSRGGIAFRHADPSIADSLERSRFSGARNRSQSSRRAQKQASLVRNHYNRNPRMSYINSGRINMLSPAEKYDLLVGDKQQTLTQMSLLRGVSRDFKYRHPESGRLLSLSIDKEASDGPYELYNGMCDGAALASFYEKRPTSPVTVTAVGGEEITFYPDDLKALMTLYWFKNEPEYQILTGNQSCSSRTKNCYNKINPAAWHLAVLNQVGSNRLPVFFDTDTSHETWNAPVRSYRVQYFNHENPSLRYDSVEEALLDRSVNYLVDNFEKFRAKNAKYLLGVEMEVEYLGSTRSGAYSSNTPRHDAVKTITYRYDLEIGSNGEVLGGEWISYDRPDTLWMPNQNTDLNLDIENELGLSWDGYSPISLASQLAARGGVLEDGTFIPSHSYQMLPLPHIFRRLVEMAQ